MSLNASGWSDNLVPKLQEVPEELRLSLSEAENEVRLYLAWDWISYKLLWEIQQVFDGKKPGYIILQFSYFDLSWELHTWETRVKNINYFEKYKVNSFNLNEPNTDYRFNIDRLRADEQILAWKLADAIKWGWEIDLKKYLIDLGINETSPVLQHDSAPKRIIEATSSGMLGTEYQFMAKDGSMHTDLEWLNAANEAYNRQMFPLKAIDGSLHLDMEWVERANKSFWDSMKIIPKDEYIIPILTKKDSHIIPKNPK